jgi:NADPH:quinone reductase-like Zn-dependent oxidoreductase
VAAGERCAEAPAGVGNWDEFVRTGGWDVGARPPRALDVDAAGMVMAAGRAAAGQALSHVLNVRAGEQLLVHGAGGVTGGLLVALAARAAPRSSRRQDQPASSGVTALGARHVIALTQAPGRIGRCSHAVLRRAMCPN